MMMTVSTTRIRFFDDDTPPFQPPMGMSHMGPGPRPRPRPRPRPPFFQPFPPSAPGGPFVDGSQGIRRCLNRVTMIWLHSGVNFWFYIDNVTPEWIGGFRWTRTGWVRDRINRRNIRFFDCQ